MRTQFVVFSQVVTKKCTACGNREYFFTCRWRKSAFRQPSQSGFYRASAKLLLKTKWDRLVSSSPSFCIFPISVHRADLSTHR